MRADEILARVVGSLLEKTGTDSRELDDFIVGSAMDVTEQWTFGGRTPLFLANISRVIGHSSSPSGVVPEHTD